MTLPEKIYTPPTKKVATAYIAGPMTGLPDKNMSEFIIAEQRLREAGWHVLNPARLEEWTVTGGARARGEKKPWDWWMRRTLRMLLEADVIALLPYWYESRGANLEVKVASELEMPRVSIEYLLTEEDRKKRGIELARAAEWPGRLPSRRVTPEQVEMLQADMKVFRSNNK